jgi:hypothetical protein
MRVLPLLSTVLALAGCVRTEPAPAVELAKPEQPSGTRA